MVGHQFQPAAAASGSGSIASLTWTKTPRVVATRSFSLASQGRSEARLVAARAARSPINSVHGLCKALAQSNATRVSQYELVAPPGRKAVGVFSQYVVAPSDSVSVRAAQSHAAEVSPQQSVERNTGLPSLLRRRLAACEATRPAANAIAEWFLNRSRSDATGSNAVPPVPGRLVGVVLVPESRWLSVAVRALTRAATQIFVGSTL